LAQNNFKKISLIGCNKQIKRAISVRAYELGQLKKGGNMSQQTWRG
jgi:hypothetical protein